MGQLLYRSLNYSIIHYASRLLITLNRDALFFTHHLTIFTTMIVSGLPDGDWNLNLMVSPGTLWLR